MFILDVCLQKRNHYRSSWFIDLVVLIIIVVQCDNEQISNENVLKNFREIYEKSMLIHSIEPNHLWTTAFYLKSVYSYRFCKRNECWKNFKEKLNNYLKILEDILKIKNGICYFVNTVLQENITSVPTLKKSLLVV